MKLRDQILNVRDLKEREVVIPEWASPEAPEGVKVLVRELTGAERYKMAAMGGQSIEKIGMSVFAALIWCVLDPETRKPVFEPADLDSIKGMSAVATDRLRTAMYELSGLAAEAVKDAEKNSPTTAQESISSLSPNSSIVQ